MDSFIDSAILATTVIVSFGAAFVIQIAALRRVFGEEPGGERWIETFS